MPDAVPQLKLPLKGQAGSTDLLLMEFSRLLDLKIPEAGNLSTIQHANWVHDNTMPSATGTPVSRRASVFLPCLTTRAQKGVLWPQQSDLPSARYYWPCSEPTPFLTLLPHLLNARQEVKHLKFMDRIIYFGSSLAMQDVASL